MGLKIKIKPILIRFLKNNIGVPFIIIFQILLLACAGLLIQGDSISANKVAIVAYYLLIVGILLQSGILIMHRKKGLL